MRRSRSNAHARTARHSKRRILGLVALLCLLLLLVDAFAYPFGDWLRGRSANRQENGLWLRYTWYFGLYHDTDAQALAGRLEHEQVRWAFLHVRDIKPDGTLRYRRLGSARRLVSLLHRSAPGVKAIAWIYAGNSRGSGHIDLSRVEVRRAMVRQAIWLVRDCGFDGIQWDYEICPDGDPGLLALLRETRAAIGPNKTLSVATGLWLPRPLQRWGWSDAYFAEVARSCDQMSVMGYDTACYLPRAYVWLMHQQVVHVTQAAARADPECRVLIGVPTYAAGGLSHDSQIENIEYALLGVRDGVADPRTQRASLSGVAIFADYTTQPGEWRAYERMWVSSP